MRRVPQFQRPAALRSRGEYHQAHIGIREFILCDAMHMLLRASEIIEADFAQQGQTDTQEQDGDEGRTAGEQAVHSDLRV